MISGIPGVLKPPKMELHQLIEEARKNIPDAPERVKPLKEEILCNHTKSTRYRCLQNPRIRRRGRSEGTNLDRILIDVFIKRFSQWLNCPTATDSGKLQPQSCR